MLRIQARCPPPGSSSRSGSLVIDLHNIRVLNGSNSTRKASARFIGQGSTSAGPNEDVLLSIQCQRILIACSLSGESKATAVLSLGPLVTAETSTEQATSTIPFGSYQPTVHREAGDMLYPSIKISRPISRAQPLPGTTQSVVVCADIPSVHVRASKAAVDGLQYWADDIAQLIERSFGSANAVDSRDSSLIGSRFFAKSRNGSGSDITAGHAQPNSETVVKMFISEGMIRLPLFPSTRAE